MDSSRERVCPSCSAPAQSDQHWCLECGAELPEPSKRSGLKPIVGIATTLTVLVGAASAGGYTLLQDGKKPPPPAATVAQQPPPAVTTPPATDPIVPPATDPATTPELPGGDTATPPATGGGGSTGGGGGTGGGTSNDVPDLTDDVDTSTPNPPPPDDDADDVDDPDGSVEDDPDGRDRRAARRPAKPRLRETNIALGAVAVTYPPDASGVDLGDPGAIVDGSQRSAWKTPAYEDPATNPQVGVYVDLASAERLTKMLVSSTTPGATVEVYGARSGPPRAITGSGWTHLTDFTLEGRSTVPLPGGAGYRYVLLWVTGLPAGSDHASIAEVEILSKQPE